MAKQLLKIAALCLAACGPLGISAGTFYWRGPATGDPGHGPYTVIPSWSTNQNTYTEASEYPNSSTAAVKRMNIAMKAMTDVSGTSGRLVTWGSVVNDVSTLITARWQIYARDNTTLKVGTITQNAYEISDVGSAANQLTTSLSFRKTTTGSGFCVEADKVEVLKGRLCFGRGAGNNAEFLEKLDIGSIEIAGAAATASVTQLYACALNFSISGNIDISNGSMYIGGDNLNTAALGYTGSDFVMGTGQTLKLGPNGRLYFSESATYVQPKKMDISKVSVANTNSATDITELFARTTYQAPAGEHALRIRTLEQTTEKSRIRITYSGGIYIDSMTRTVEAESTDTWTGASFVGDSPLKIGSYDANARYFHADNSVEITNDFKNTSVKELRVQMEGDYVFKVGGKLINNGVLFFDAAKTISVGGVGGDFDVQDKRIRTAYPSAGLSTTAADTVFKIDGDTGVHFYNSRFHDMGYNMTPAQVPESGGARFHVEKNGKNTQIFAGQFYIRGSVTVNDGLLCLNADGYDLEASVRGEWGVGSIYLNGGAFSGALKKSTTAGTGGLVIATDLTWKGGELLFDLVPTSGNDRIWLRGTGTPSTVFKKDANGAGVYKIVLAVSEDLGYYQKFNLITWDENDSTDFQLQDFTVEVRGNPGSATNRTLELTPTGLNVIFSAPGFNPENAIKISTDHPGGNVILQKFTDNEVYLSQDLRDTAAWWFYWNFKASNIAGKTVTYKFTKPGGSVMCAKGPVCSVDGGETWQYIDRGANPVSNTFTFTAPDGVDEVFFSFSLPYLEKDLLAFLAEYEDNPTFEVLPLAVTNHGRQNRYIRINEGGGAKPHRIMMTSRHHSCEASGSFVLEGIIREIMSDSETGKRLRANVEFFIVPMMDLDGVQEGDQGKARSPYDHNMAYRADTRYPEIAATMAKIDEFSAERTIDMFMDIHAPSVDAKPNANGVYNEHTVMHIVGSSVASVAIEEVKFSQILQRVNASPLPYFIENNLPFGTSWNTGDQSMKSAGYAARKPNARFANTLEVPYSSVRGVTTNRENYLAFGTSVAKALLEYTLQGTVAYPTATPQGDGITDLEKYVFGLDMSKPAAYADNPLYKHYADTNGNFCLEYPVNTDATRVGVTPYYSEDLINWTALTPVKLSGEEGFDIYKAQKSLSESASGKLFFKLELTEN